MATTAAQPATNLVGDDQSVMLCGIDWRGYSLILRVRGERSTPKMIYLDGSLLLVSPSYVHEFRKKRLGSLVTVVVEELDIDHVPAASTTFRRRGKRGGVEGDEAFYLTNAMQVQGKRSIDLRTDPPPDLAIEAVHTHDAQMAVEVYRRLRVPEVWICDEEQLRILVRQVNGRYRAAESSAAFPFLRAEEIFAWVTRPTAGSETVWLKELRRWVRETLAPRRAAAQS
jgi:Uma2 family endonuclease